MLTALLRSVAPRLSMVGRVPATSFSSTRNLHCLASSHSSKSIYVNPQAATFPPGAGSFSLIGQSRQYGIFILPGSHQLWEGVAGPPGGHKKRARGKRRVTRPKIDLNRGQSIGEGKSAMVWPGLSHKQDLTENNQLRLPYQGEIDAAHTQRIQEFRNRRVMKRKKITVPPLLRGWSGGGQGGKSIGPPEPIYDYKFDGFDTRILELKVVTCMRATTGRTRRFSAFVFTGNGKGLGGYGLGKGTTGKSALNKAKLRAGMRLEYFERRDNRTLWHNAYVREWKTTIFAMPQPEGRGVVAHRCLKTMCDLLGIKDLYAKVEGNNKNYQNISKGFCRLLRNQETYQQLSDREHLHVVEFRKENDDFPRLLASPQAPQTPGETGTGLTRTVSPDEDLDLDRYYYDGQVPRLKSAYIPGYWNLPGNKKKAAERYRFRNQDEAHRRRKVYETLYESKENSQGEQKEQKETVN